MKYCLIKRAVNAIVVDDDDVDRDPETIKVYGKVTFTPQVNDGDIIQYAGVDGVTSMVLPPITVSISDGEIMHRGGVGVKLAAGGPGCNPKTIRWRADFTNMQAGGWAFNLKPVVFDAIPDGEVDLTIVAPLASTSEPITRGPAGVSVSNITVDGSYLVFTGTSEAGSSELARIPLEPVVAAAAASVPDATSSVKGKVRLAGDLGGTADTPKVPGLASKADLNHTHSIGQVTGLQTALDGKAALVGGLIPTAQLPAVALTKPQVVPDRAGMLALTAQEGDVAVITAGADKGTYMLGSGSPTVFESWVALAAPTDAVTSVNGQTGVVNLSASNVGAAPSSHTHTSAQISDAVSTPTASMVMKRDSAGRAQVADPSAAADAATKKYVDDRIATRLASISSPGIVYGTDGSGNQAAYSVKNAVVEWSLAQRGAAGTLKVGDPIVASDAATKKYVDDGLASKADLMGGLVPTSQLPAVALTKPQVVPDRAGMLALTAQEGDVAVITAGTDKGTYMLGPGASTNFASWVALAAPTDAVTSVNGQTGVVNLSASNVGAAPSSHTHTSAQISDAVSTPTASMVMKRDSAGRAQVADPSAAADIATKGYVDTGLNGKANTSHTHTSAQVSDALSTTTASTANAGKVVEYNSTGRISAPNPSDTTDVANKGYVDGMLAALNKNTVTVETEAQATALTELRVGDYVQVLDTGNIYKVV